jgi:tetratricopeptide (TPR) repeat protein
MDASESQSHDLVKFLAWLEVNKKRVALGAGGLMVVIIVIIGVVQSRAQKEVQASQALSEVRPPRGIGEVPPAETLEAYLRVAREFAGTKAAERALALAGAGFFTAGNYPEALKQFETLLKSYPESMWLPEASLGVAATLSAQGKTNEAMAKYEEVRRRHATSPVADEAKLALAQIYEGQGKPEEAFKLYEDLLRGAASYQRAVTMQAQIRRQELVTKHPELVRPKEPPAPPTLTPTLTPTGAVAQLTNLMVTASNPPALPTNRVTVPATNPPPTNTPLLLKSLPGTNK